MQHVAQYCCGRHSSNYKRDNISEAGVKGFYHSNAAEKLDARLANLLTLLWLGGALEASPQFGQTDTVMAPMKVNFAQTISNPFWQCGHTSNCIDDCCAAGNLQEKDGSGNDIPFSR